jgi:hypothetical protein
VTKTQIKPRHAEPEPEPELIEEPAPAQFQGRTEAPSGFFPATEEPAPAAASADPNETADIPLISPPDEERQAPPPSAAKEGPPPPGKKEETKRKFSWQRK